MATQYAILAEKYKNILSKSPTAYNPGAAPTLSDISAQQQLMRTQAAEEITKGEELKQKWYGERDTTEDAGSKKSYLQGVLHTLGAPLYGIVGSVEALLGKGTKKGLANIPENIKEQGLFGDLLRSYGMSNLMAAPLGFALDVAGDPINWLTAGTAALVPRIGIGAIKGGLTGAKAGLESGALMKAEKLGRLVPGLTKKAFSEIPEQAGKTMATGYRNLAKKAVESREAYETITGTGLNKLLEESVTKVRVFDRLENWLNQRPWGQKTVKMLGYSPSRGFLQRGREDVANKIAGEIPEGMMGRAGSQVDSLLGKDAKETVEWAKNPSAMLPRHSIENDIRLAKEVNDDILQKKIIQKEMGDLNKGLLAGDERLLTKLNSLSENQQKEFFSTLNYYRSGTKTYDKQIVKALLSSAGRKTLNSYALFIGAFKNAKIGGGILSSGTNAMVGNPVMATMFGIDITNPNFYKSLKESLKIITGKDYRAFLRNPEILKYAREYPIQFTSVTGIYPAQMTQGGKFFDKNFVNSITNEARKLGKNFDFKNVEDLNKVIDETLLKSNIGVESVNSTIANYLDRGIETSMMSTEIMRGPMGEMVKNLKKLSDEGNTLASMAHWYLTVPLETYSKIDQGYKVGTLLHFVENGISNDELIKMAKRIPISPNDVSQIPGRNLWKIKPSKSLEIANEMYMDYLAMPGFVKIMRTIPLVGSPFMCRSEDTEMLTNNGWKRYNDICPGDLAMSYNLKDKFLEWQPIIKVYIYDINNEDLYHIKSRSLDIIASPDHDMVVACRKNIEKGRINGKRIRSKGEFIPQKIKMKKLVNTTVPSIVVGAENGFKANNFKIVSDEIVELIGWFVTEGSYVYKRDRGGYGSFGISQAKPEGVEKIKNLIDRMGTKYNIQIKKKKEGTMMNYDNYFFRFSAELKRIIDIFVPTKQLTINFLNLLTKEQLLLLYNTMIMADGNIGSSGEECFCQKFNETSESFQVLILMIGKSCTDYGGEKRNGNKIINANKGLYRQIKRNMPKKIKYTGKIWCPQVLGNGTWVARRNGRIDITGNSFMYGISAQTAKAAVYNPSVFNKVNYFIKEISGERSPLEKEALKQPYYEWYNRPGMLKLPFFEENPVYLNMENMIPYYTMNVFQPAERDYKNKYGDAVAAVMDKLPFFKDPAGQIMFDYFVQPLILQGEQPKGMFDQPLWTQDAGALEKIGRGTQALTESVMPTMAGYAGLVVPWGETGEKITPYLPSYRWRQLAFAKKGKSSVGIPVKEPTLERTARVMSAMAGWPTYQIKLRYNK